ncbi:zinc finger protein 3-like [Platysternon megacephalum]|uniref:Zinc finger protein 3-like n=1 Tax=Platysternon megacephalum TaxID=55544 RepID=A0A4D9DT32_9SAUR|nr:zinc finger protein 3-like [Platysternon megacephalum]
MSWVIEEWKEGLSTRVLQKIQELESQLDKLKKERQQRQFQLESLEAALQKQKQKVENEKNEGATLKRENQSLMELCDNLEKTKQKISHDLQVKESQVNYQAGQLTSSKKQIERLEQELKRYKSELERSQQTLITGDLSCSSTPQKNVTAPLTPNLNHNDSKFEELQEKYNKEVEERERLEAELRNIQVKKINHSHPQSTKSHREIARHQASSSVFSWQQEKTPSCPSSSSQETPLKRGFTSSHFPWEQEATPSHSGLRSKKTDFNNRFSDNCGNSSVIKQLKTQNQELSSRVQELEHQLQDQEKEKKFHMNKLQEIQLQMEKTKLEFTEKDSVLHKIRDELTRMTAQRDQATAQYEMAEQKMKKLSELLNCQRQNAESARGSLEQKVKEKEKEYQKELFRQQHSLQTMDQQCNQIQAKLNQDLQQAKNHYNALKAELDKTSPTEQENNGMHQLQVHSLPNENLAPKREKPEIKLCEQITIEENSECENVAEVTEARSAEECPAKLISETEYRNTLEKKIDCHSELSFSNHNISITPLVFLENQVAIETLQLQIKQTSSENLKLLHGIEESNTKVDALLIEIKELNSRLDLQHTELTAKITAYAELEKTVLVLKKENSDLNEKLECVSFDKQQISYKVMILEKELDKAKSDLDVYKVRLSDVTDMLEDLKVTKGDWHEKFLETENELRRTKSEKENIENHALSIEGDIEELQRKNQQLEKDSENKLKTISTLQEQLAVITTEKNQLSQELSILSENKEESDQLYQKLQEKIKELESNKVDATEFIRILEAEAKTQTKLLQTTKSDVDQLSRGKDYLVQQLQNVEKDAEILTLEKEKFQNQMQDLEEEKKLILRESEMLQTKLSESEMENSKLSKTLEGSLIEKGELAARLNSTQEEVDQLRYGIEKLKIKIESDEKKKRHTVEKLKESERKADFLLDKIEKLERELQMSDKYLEDAILQAETAYTETETLKTEMEEMAERLKSLELAVNAFRSEKEGSNKELQEKQEKISELESSNSNIVRLLEEKEKENMQIKEESENVMVLIKSQLKNASEEIKLSFNELEICKTKEQDLIHQVGCLEHDKTQLLLDLQEARNISTKLEQSLGALVQELADCKQTRDEKIQENGALQKKIKDVEQLSVQLSHAESERECWMQEKEGLQNLIDVEPSASIQLSNNEMLKTTLENLKASPKDLEKELESTRSEKSALVEKNEVEIQACQGKLNSLEQCLGEQKLEMELLKSSKEQLNNSLKDANQTIEELKKVKVDNLKRIVQLKKQNEFARSKMEMRMKSCKQLEKEKKMLQKQIAEHDALLKKQKPSADEVASAEEMRLKLEELKESVEEKTKEAEENLEKYCTLIINYYKLEETNEMLKTQVSLLNAQLKQPANAINSPSQNSDNPVTLNNQSVTEKRSDEDPTKLSGKRQRCQEAKKVDGEPKSPIPETLSKKIKKGAIYQHSLTHENTEYEPDGLPEVVKKGFADIPIEKISPYVLRRTTLNLRTSPRLTAQSQKLSPCAQRLQKGRSDNPVEISKPTAGGSKSQKVDDTQQCQAETAIEPMESSSRSPLCINKQPTKAVAETSRENLNTHKGRCSFSTKTLPDQNEQENCMVQ